MRLASLDCSTPLKSAAAMNASTALFDGIHAIKVESEVVLYIHDRIVGRLVRQSDRADRTRVSRRRGHPSRYRPWLVSSRSVRLSWHHNPAQLRTTREQVVLVLLVMRLRVRGALAQMVEMPARNLRIGFVARCEPRLRSV
jgi:hypothetical protein